MLNRLRRDGVAGANQLLLPEPYERYTSRLCFPFLFTELIMSAKRKKAPWGHEKMLIGRIKQLFQISWWKKYFQTHSKPEKGLPRKARYNMCRTHIVF